MITISLISIIYSVFGWIKRYKEHDKTGCDMNPFNYPFTIEGFLFIMANVFSFIFILILIIFYLP